MPRFALKQHQHQQLESSRIVRSTRVTPKPPGDAHPLLQLQRTFGNQALLKLQRDTQTEKEVKAVKSENVSLREHEVQTAETQLAARMAKREAEIQAAIAELGPEPKSEKAKTRLAALQKDLAKDLATIIKEPDSKGVYKGLRADIIESARYVDTQKLNLKSAQDQWAKYDPIFAGKEVADALGKQTLTAAEFKALVAQESGDLTKSDPKGDIAGIAQLGTKEEKLAGAKPGDRKKPEKALVIAATVISKYADQLDKELSVKPEGVERKKFIMAAYNSGVNAVATAQREAIKMGRDGKTWQSLIQGGEESPLYKAIVATYPKKTNYAVTYAEKSEYPEKILARLP
ncbi:MAG: transglycosylase SLT domain-containing protein [Nitrososphaerales archaeon]